MNEILLARKQRIENELINFSIKIPEIISKDYLQFKDENFVEPNEVFIRAIILYYLAISQGDPEIQKAIKRWFSVEQIVNLLTESEKKILYPSFTTRLFSKTNIAENEYDFYANMESAYVLLWCLGLVQLKLSPSGSIDENQLNLLFKTIPKIGESISNYSAKLELIDKEVLFIESSFYELGVAYLRDCSVFNKQNESALNVSSAFVRHKTLNWVRQFPSKCNWDIVDTST